MGGSGPRARRWSVVGGLGMAALLAPLELRSEAPRPRSPGPLLLVVARGDVDNDGLADRFETRWAKGALEGLPSVSTQELPRDAKAPSQGVFRLLAEDGGLLAGAARIAEEAPTSRRLRVMGQAPGRGVLGERAGPREVWVVDVRVFAVDGGELDAAHTWVSLGRGVPAELGGDDGSVPQDEEAVSFLLVGPGQALPERVEIVSQDPRGKFRDSLERVPLQPTACPDDVPRGDLVCRRTPPLRIVGDAVDRAHPSLIERSIVGEVGGRIALLLGSSARLSLPVGAPRALEPGGPGRYRVRLRARVVRGAKHGAPSVGANDEEARQLVLAEIAASSQVWGQCGVHFGDPAEVDLQIVDPPEPTFVSVGCDAGLPASGGELGFDIEGRSLRLKTAPGQTPEAVAGRLAELLDERGYRVERFKNPRSDGSALPTFDVGIKSKSGKRVALRAERGREFSSDPSLRVCALDVSLDDGLDHFGDGDSASGTLEERALLRALLDDDPETIDLLIVPIFAGLGRIGESFIWSPGASIQNALILDRGGVRASTRSFTLSHELGHILLDMPGHPDDYGVDRPSSLMDADAADGTVFGPRRLSLADCKRALRQSGPMSPVPLLTAWPLKVKPDAAGR